MYNNSITAVHVEATDRCNAQCPVCIRSYQGGPEREKYVTNSELGLAHFTDYLGDKFCSNIVNWNFCGNKGDPSSALELVDIFEYLLKCNPHTQIDVRTNGGARSVEFWKSIGRLFENTRCNIIFAVDGLEDTNHIYRKNVKWSNLYRNMKAYFKNGGYGNGQFDTLKFYHNQHQWEEIGALANRFGVKVNFKEPYGFAKLPNGLLKTIPVYDRNLTDGEHKVLYTIKPHTTKKYIDPEYFPRTPEDIADDDPPFYNYEDDNIFKFSHTKIDCVANQPEKNHYEIFLDCDGSVYPCCFIGSRMNYGEMQLKNMQGNTDIVLSESNTIDKILSSNYYKKVLPAGINGTFEGDLTLGGKTNYCLTCVDCCGMNMELSHIKKT